MSESSLLDAVRTEDVEFATMRPPGSRYSVLERKVVITAPPELEKLAALGDPAVLDELVDLLDDPARAFAAAVVLAAVTGRDAKEVEAFSTTPEKWWPAVGSGAQERWRDWLDEAREQLRWDPEARTFVVER